jgi:FkbM family methyltransferase
VTQSTFNLSVNRAGVTHQLRMRLDPEQFSQGLMCQEFQQGRLYEHESSVLLTEVLRLGDMFVDVGAHIGYFTLLAAKLVGSTGQVVSFEPDQTNFDHLVGHVRDNDLTNVRAFRCAVGQQTGVVDFFLNADNDGGHAVWDIRSHPFNARSRAGAVRRQSVYMTSLDEALGADTSRVRAIKIDTEGAELAVLRGARRLLERGNVLVHAEINPHGLAQLGTSATELRAWLAELGYEGYDQQPNRLVRLETDTPIDTRRDSVFNMVFMRPRLARELLSSAAA